MQDIESGQIQSCSERAAKRPDRTAFASLSLHYGETIQRSSQQLALAARRPEAQTGLPERAEPLTGEGGLMQLVLEWGAGEASHMALQFHGSPFN